MKQQSKIEWTQRSDWNPVRGCTRHSKGCRHCYAEVIAGRFSGPGQPFEGFATRHGGEARWTGKVEVMWDRLLLPLSWTKPAMIFANSTSDIFHEKLSMENIAAIYAVAIAAHHLRGHTIQILTKRPDRARALLRNPVFWWLVNAEANSRGVPIIYGPANPPPGIWLGTSVEDQRAANNRIPHLLDTPAAIRFLSCEPLLGPVDLTRIMEAGREECFYKEQPVGSKLGYKAWSASRSSLNCLTGHYWGEDLIDNRWEGWCEEHLQPSPGFGQPGHFMPIDLVISGGESGHGSRPSHPDWHRSLRDQSAGAGVPFFFKQWGDWISIYDRDRDDPNWNRCPKAGDWDKKRYLNLAGGQGFHGEALNMMSRVGKARAGRLLDGVEHNGMPT